MSTPAPQVQHQAWDDPYRPPRHPFRWLWVVPALAFLYALSFGPASGLAARGLIPATTLDRIYQPLDWLADTSPKAKRLQHRYAELWVRGQSPPRPRP